MATHIVKSWSMFFIDILAGERTSDIRLNDRHYVVGDFMVLQEFDPVKFVYTGRKQVVQITYLQQNKSNPCAISREALADGYVVLSIKLVKDELEIPPEFDVRKILLGVTPGDGSGYEVYAKSNEDVIAKLSKLGEELEEWQLGIRRLSNKSGDSL